MKAFKKIKDAYFQQGSFTRNIIVFVSGSAASFVVGAVFTPVITRIYETGHYGLFAFFNTLASIFVAVSSLGFSEALVLPKSSAGFFNLSRIIVAISASIGILLTLLLVLFRQPFLEYFQVTDLGYWIFCLPVMVVLTSYQQIADSYNIRKKQFAVNAKSRVVSVVTGKASVSVMGLSVGSFAGGLIIGELIIRVITYVMLLGRKSFQFFRRTFGRWKWSNFRHTVIQYKNYPLYVFPSAILIQVAIQIPVFFVSRMYDVDKLGYYALATSLLGIPVQIIAFSLGKVFLQRASELSDDHALLRPMIQKLYYVLILVGSLGYGVVFVAGPDLFRWFAGKGWGQSGEIASMMCFAMIFQITAIALGPTFRVMRRERTQFAMNFAGSLVMIVVLFVSSWLNLTFQNFIYLTATLLAFRFVLVLVGIFVVARIDVVRHLPAGLLIISLIFLIFSKGLLFLQYLAR